ncbi:MAG: hypothetical protein AAB457_02435 [Patescibacteria group bacterium]|mgnify:FL=1
MIEYKGLYQGANTGSGGPDADGSISYQFTAAQQKGLDKLRKTGSLKDAFRAFGEGLSDDVISGEAVDPKSGKMMIYIIVNPTQEQRDMAAQGLFPADSVPSIPLGPEEQAP